tara:strand:- start:3361 stop:3867 length:507 start_codon:yes stop_codon:yes gene_type:complete
MKGGIRNKIAEAGLITVDLLDFLSNKKQVGVDLRDWLVDDLIIKEINFKERLKKLNIDGFKNCNVFIYCSKDVIIPTWAFLLIQAKINTVASFVFFGNEQSLNLILFERSIQEIDTSKYINKRVFIKGCGDRRLPIGSFSIICQKLMPIVKSLFYGEACSNVPLIKNP